MALTFSPYGCVWLTRSKSLILNFAIKKNEYGKKHIQSAVLCERQQGEERYCPHHGTGDNQRDCGAVQLQAEHPTLGREREPRVKNHISSGNDLKT